MSLNSTGMTVQRADGTSEVQIMSEEVIRYNRWISISRHSKICTCSWCNPWSLGLCRALPKPGRFGIEVPPKGNRWRWTHVYLRVGEWVYYATLQVQLFPSIWPFFQAEKWQGTIPSGSTQ